MAAVSNQILPPQTDWTRLNGPVETVSHKISRRIGKFLFFSALPVGVLAVYSVKFPLKVASLVLAVMGAALWRFNYLNVNVAALQRRRLEIGEQIETKPLVHFYHSTPENTVFSSDEFNSWLLYLLKTTPFAAFMNHQTDNIFPIGLRFDLCNTLHIKYLKYLEESPVGLKDVDKQVAFTYLLSQNDKDEWKKKLVQPRPNETYADYIARNGVEAIDLITDPAARDRLYESFEHFVLDKNVGVIPASVRYATILQRFQKTPQGLYEKILEREVRDLEYIPFMARNWIDAPVFKEVMRTILKKKWDAMSFREILQKDGDFLYSSLQGPLSCFSPSDWTPKATEETKECSFEQKTTIYIPLYRMGILNPDDLKTFRHTFTLGVDGSGMGILYLLVLKVYTLDQKTVTQLQSSSYKGDVEIPVSLPGNIDKVEVFLGANGVKTLLPPFKDFHFEIKGPDTIYPHEGKLNKGSLRPIQTGSLLELP